MRVCSHSVIPMLGCSSQGAATAGCATPRLTTPVLARRRNMGEGTARAQLVACRIGRSCPEPGGRRRALEPRPPAPPGKRANATLGS